MIQVLLLIFFIFIILYLTFTKEGFEISYTHKGYNVPGRQWSSSGFDTAPHTDYKPCLSTDECDFYQTCVNNFCQGPIIKYDQYGLYNSDPPPGRFAKAIPNEPHDHKHYHDHSFTRNYG